MSSTNAQIAECAKTLANLMSEPLTKDQKQSVLAAYNLLLAAIADTPTPTVNLIGIGNHKAKKVSELKVGETIVYNYGEIGLVYDIKQITPKTYALTVREKQNTYTIKKRDDSLVAYR